MNIICTQASLVAQLVKNLPAVQESWVRSLGREDPLEKDAHLENIPHMVCEERPSTAQARTLTQEKLEQ